MNRQKWQRPHKSDEINGKNSIKSDTYLEENTKATLALAHAYAHIPTRHVFICFRNDGANWQNATVKNDPRLCLPNENSII